MCAVCGTMLDPEMTAGVADNQGCLLPLDHAGPHEFVSPRGESWLWELDLDCDCEHCMRCEGDYCIVYWKKENPL